MPVTEFYAFNLIYENLLAALYGVALRRYSLGSYFILSLPLSLQRSLQALARTHFLPHTPHISYPQ